MITFSKSKQIIISYLSQQLISFKKADRTPKPLNEPSNFGLLAAANNDKTTPINPEDKAEDKLTAPIGFLSEAKDKATEKPTKSQAIAATAQAQQTLDKMPFQNVELTSILNSIYKQANQQSENQRTQYERLTKKFNDSIQAKSAAEQEQINKFNNVIATIEKTFSAGTFDHIIEHIDNMVTQFIRNQEAKNNDFNNKFDYIDKDINELLNAIKQQQEAIDSI